jgi:type VI secretion system protein ImpH
MSDLDALLGLADKLPFIELVHRILLAHPSAAPIGGDGPFRDEALRFRHDPDLRFHAGDVSRVVQVADGRVELTTTFAGLTGSTSPLPASFVEAIARDDEDSAVERELLDAFHHRLLSLFYRGLLKFDLPRTIEAGHAPNLLSGLLCIAGLPADRAEEITGLGRDMLLRLLPLLVTYPANAERIVVAIRDVLAKVLGSAQVRVLSMTGGYVPIEASARARLGIDMRLGRTSTIGGRAPAPASEITVRIEGLRPADCARLSPGGDHHMLLANVVLLLVPETVRTTIELTPTHAPSAPLGSTNARLGKSSWLGGRGSPKPVRVKVEPSPRRQEHHAS